MARKKPKRDEGAQVAGSTTIAGAADACASFRLPASVTIHGARELKATLLQFLGNVALSVELDDVREVDTAGVQLLLALRRSCEASGCSLHWRGDVGVVATAVQSLGLTADLAMAGAA